MIQAADAEAQAALLPRASQAEAEAGTDNAKMMTPLRVAEAISALGGGGGGAVTSVNGQTGDVDIAKADVGLGNVDNTSDADKPVSTATQTALDGKAASGHTHWNTQVLGGAPNRLWGAGPEGGSSWEYRLLPPLKFNENFLAVDVASQAEAEAGTDTGKLMTPQRTAQAIAALVPASALPLGASMLYPVSGTDVPYNNIPAGYIVAGNVNGAHFIGPVGSGAVYEGAEFWPLYELMYIAGGLNTAAALNAWNNNAPCSLENVMQLASMFGLPCQIIKYTP